MEGDSYSWLHVKWRECSGGKLGWKPKRCSLCGRSLLVGRNYNIIFHRLDEKGAKKKSKKSEMLTRPRVNRGVSDHSKPQAFLDNHWAFKKWLPLHLYPSWHCHCATRYFTLIFFVNDLSFLFRYYGQYMTLCVFRHKEINLYKNMICAWFSIV